MRNKIIIGLLSLLFSYPAFAGVLIYNLRVYDSSADPTAIIPKYYVADTFAELPGGLQGDYAYAKDTDKFYYYTGAAWTLLSDLSAEPFVTSAASGNLSAERVLTAGTNTTIDTGTAGQIKTNVTASGSNQYIQFNDGGPLGGDADFLWDKTNNSLGIGATPNATNGIALRKDTDAGYTITIDDQNTGTTAHTAFQALSDTGANGNNVALRSHADSRTTTQCGAALGGMNDLISVAGAGLSVCSLGTQSIYIAPANFRLLEFNSSKHIKTYGTAPTVSACGASPAIVGNDIAGKVTIGTGGITSCTVTFANAYGTAPACSIGSGASRVTIVTTSTTAMTITAGASIDSAVIMYTCMEF